MFKNPISQPSREISPIWFPPLIKELTKSYIFIDCFKHAWTYEVLYFFLPMVLVVLRILNVCFGCLLCLRSARPEFIARFVVSILWIGTSFIFVESTT
jgi:hypothetical protein